jgi:3-hydroxymyristoyl/3-hydroxydecanoyl-(acyl carrier protein) dehydratase
VLTLRDLNGRGSPIAFPLRRPKITLPRINDEMQAYRTEVPRSHWDAERVLERAPSLAPVTDANGSGKPAIRNHASYSGVPDIAAASVAETAATRNRHPADALQLVQEHHKQLASLHKAYLNIQSETQTAAMALIGNVLKGTVPAAFSTGQKMAVPPEDPLPVQKTKRYPGPSFDRSQLEILASGKISSIFGPLFEKQDDYDIQVRMPGPPLLLCDRVLGIAGDPGSMGVGTIWTETDVQKDSWYLHHGRMPACIFIEAGQADLLLISWLGVDFLNQGKRAYRLLGCEFTYKGSLPEPGDTLEYEIHVDGHANQGDVRLFFFHYDCRIRGETRIMVRNGQAGFFTTEELQKTGGAIWDPRTAPYRNDPVLALPEHHTQKHRFSREDVLAYSKGEMTTCFGEELAWTDTHTRTPRSQAGEQNLLGVITDFDLSGGPAGRGYLRMERAVSSRDWFFQAHFKNDPCMPGSLMAEACVQAMSFYMVGAGLTALKDGWRFEPVQNERNTFICRGQVMPESRLIAVEIFVDDVIAEPVPILYAHVLFTVDGMKAFLCECVGLTLTPDWPFAGGLPMEKDAGRIASLDGFFFDDASVLNCALGRPSLAFGKRMSGYDTGIRSPRLPAPPYLFISRIADLNAQPGRTQGRPWIVAEYDIPEDAWYFSANNAPSMPFCALMEIGLQPCGWLSTFALSDDLLGKEIFYRNLDGTAIQHREITPADRKITVKTILDSSARTGDIIINTFDVCGTADDDVVFTLQAVFGFFPPESMQSQKGLPINKEEQENLKRAGSRLWKLRSQTEGLFSASVAGIPSPKLLMLDAITGYWPEGGKDGLGYIRAEKEVKAHDWFFKAHFFQDPVQPGSLGIEAMIQLIKCYMLMVPRQTDIQQPRFQPIDIGSPTQWHYRGQVTPDKKRIVVDLDILEDRVDDDGRRVCAEARLWIDGLKIYHVPRIGVRLVDSKNPDSTLDTRLNLSK